MFQKILSLTACAAVCAAAAPSPNLLDNSGFEITGGRDEVPEGWSLHVPAGGAAVVDREVRRSGAGSLRLQVPEEAPQDWYQAYRAVQPLRPGRTYCLSAWVSCRDVAGGAGAYISLNCFDGNGSRLAYHDSPARLTGTAGWTRLVTTAALPPGTSELRVILCLHGHGTAWFDDVQVEDGTAPTEYQPSAGDTDLLARRQADAEAAAAWVADLRTPAPGKARIGILDMGPSDGFPAPLPGSLGACPSDPAVLAAAFEAAGHVAVLVPPERLQNTAFLDPSVLDLLVVPGGDLFPASGHRALTSYLRHGGALVAMGGYAFDRPVVRHEGRWHDPAALPIPEMPGTLLFGGGARLWSPSTNRPEPPSIAAAEGPGGLPGIELATPDLQGWDSAISADLAGTLPPGWSVTRLWARGDALTPSVWVEWSETDGARWHKAIPLSTEWHEYALTPADFTYWHDNPSVGRGGPADRFRPEQASRFQVGIATDIAARGQAHRVWVAGVRVHADPLAGLRVPPPRINTRWGRIRDALWPEPEQLGVFDPAFTLRQVARTIPAPEQAVVAGYTLDGPLAGYSATAMLGLNGHGFGPNRARWVPLLECRDRFGRARGHAGAIVHHFAGAFAGSSWAVFGVTDRDLFAAGSPALSAVLLPAAEALLRRVYLHETDTAFASYRPGETVTLRTRVTNAGRAPCSVEVRFAVTSDRPGAGSGASVVRRAVSLDPGQTVSVEEPWPLPESPADFYRVRVELWDGERCIDLDQAAFVVWSPETLARGPRLSRRGTWFELDGEPLFLMGCQTYWGQNGSVTARSPLAFDRDFRQMRDFGLRWTRCFIPFHSESDKRVSDAIVQLAQKHGLVLYHTPNLQNTADPEELDRQLAVSREIAERYRGVPGLAVDICNEPAFAAADAGLRRRCGDGASTAGPWADAGVRALWRCMAECQRAWAAGHARSIHQGDPSRLASVGWSQGWAGGESMKDPILASLDLDFTDRHYYGRLAGFTAELKDLDLRLLGKPLVLGECGAKNHPTFEAADPWGMGENDAAYDRRFLYLGHHALGLGAAVLSSWHWRDPMEGIFPCGLLFSTNVPRPAAAVMRAMGLTFGRFRPAPATPPVCLLLPDSGRHSGRRDAVIRAFHRAAELLAASRVDFGLLPDSAADLLPAGQVKAVVYPVPMDPSDTVLEALARFARQGGTVYISGDISYDETGQPARRDRLTVLCGVAAEGEPLAAPLDLPPAAGSLAPVGGSGLATDEARPLLRLVLRGAEALAVCGERPVVTRFRLGQGQVWLSADPVELAASRQDGHLRLYRAVLDAAGVPRLPVSPDTPQLAVFRLAGTREEAWVFHNGGPALEARTGQWTVGLGEGGSGFLIADDAGAVRAAECQGALRRGTTELLRVSGHAFVVAEDDVDLPRSRQWLVMPLAPGEVRVATVHAAAPAAEWGEFRDGQWAPLAPAAVLPAGGQAVIQVPEEMARELLRVRW